jgi:hypothetical protein
VLTVAADGVVKLPGVDAFESTVAAITEMYKNLWQESVRRSLCSEALLDDSSPAAQFIKRHNIDLQSPTAGAKIIEALTQEMLNSQKSEQIKDLNKVGGGEGLVIRFFTCSLRQHFL